MTYLDFSYDDFGLVSADPTPSAGFVDAEFDAGSERFDGAMDVIFSGRAGR